MAWVMIGAGVLLLTVTLGDTVTTVLRAETRAGPITRFISRAVWNVANRLPSRRRHSRPPPATGVAVTIVVVLGWLVLVFLGWFLIFASSENAVVGSSTGEPADGWSRLYYTAYVISTLGIGDYVPNGGGWQSLTGLAAMSGLAVATLVITYVTSLTSAVADKRQMARGINQLGESPQAIVCRAWDGEGFDQLRPHVHSLTAEINDMAEKHMRYPVLFFYAATRRATAHWPAVAALDEALFVLDEVVDPGVRPPTLVIEPARQAIAGYLETVPGSTREDAEAPDPLIDEIEDAGIPLRPRDEVDDAYVGWHGHRCRMGSVLHHQGWSWDAVRGHAEA